MSGSVASLIASVKSGSSGPTNIFINGSATTATPIGWLGSAYSRNTSYFKTTPASWQMNDISGDGPELTYFQATGLTIGSKYSISWWSRNDPLNGSDPVTFTPLSLSGGTGTFSYTPSGTFTYYKVEGMTASATSVYVQWYASSYSALVDDIWLVAGNTAY